MASVPKVVAVAIPDNVPVASDLGNREYAVPGDITGTTMSSFTERFPPIEDSSIPYLKCKYTGVVYPNQPPFNLRTDILSPFYPKAE